MRILIISADQYEDSELLTPLQKLRAEGFAVDIASLQKEPITGKHGAKTNVNLTVEDVITEDYEMLILPGGRAPAQLRKNKKVIEIVRRFFELNKPVAAICHGPQILISAGLVKGKKMTAYKTVATELTEAGAEYTDASVVVDSNLITSRQPSDLDNFLREIKRKLSDRHEQRTQLF